ncbi:ATP-binding protein [Hymenobacter sp. B81]|uniref:tetratricopeptide repeat-containing sensor histidine kinase n=1 Tax=Hymenobacter sp. B81 TaxID=3344878 RepID=UPI0037DDCFE7
MLTRLCLSLFLMLSPALPAQPAPAAVTDTAQARRYLRQAASLIARADTGQARDFLTAAQRYSERENFPEGLAQAQLLRGNLHFTAQQYPAALAAYDQAAELLGRLPRSQRLNGLGLAALGSGEALFYQGQMEAGMKRFFQGVNYLQAAGNYPKLLACYLNIASYYHDLNQPDKARRYITRALALRPQLPDQRGLLPAYNLLAMLHIRAHNFGDAAQALARGRAVRATSPYDVAEQHRIEGIYYFETQDFAAADQHFRAALRYLEPQGNPVHLAQLYFALARTAQRRQDYAAAQRYYLRSEQQARAGRAAQQRYFTLRALAELAEQQGQTATALTYFKRYKAAEDSTQESTTKQAISRIESQYQVQQKEQQILTLRQTQRAQAAELRRQQTVNRGAGAVLLALLCAGVLGFTTLRSRQKIGRQQQLLQAQKIQELQQERQLLASEAMLRGQEEERSRLARDLHDGLGGMLSSVKYYLGSVRSAVVLPEPSAQLFTRSLEQLDGSISELRRVARDMMPEALLHFGLTTALQDVCDQLGQSRPLRVQLQTFGLTAERLPQRTELVVFRLVQELLNNVVKHADAQSVLVQLSRTDDQLQLVVEDDGRGFDSAASHRGVGLRSMQARVDYLRGALDIQTAPGQGTAITIDVPLAAPAA